MPKKCCTHFDGEPCTSNYVKIIVKMVTKMWNIINIKSPHAGFRTNDPDRNPFRDKSDDQLIKEWTTLPEAKECIVLLLIQSTHCIEH